jgi:hypothetical protein
MLCADIVMSLLSFVCVGFAVLMLMVVVAVVKVLRSNSVIGALGRKAAGKILGRWFGK